MANVIVKVYDGDGNEHDIDSKMIGDLSELNTEAKGSVVNAINEVDGRVPKVTSENNGCFVRVVDGKLSVVHLTDVSEVGA